MRAFNESQKPTTERHRNKASCSYCRNEEHQVIDCPHVKPDWAIFQTLCIPSSLATHWTNTPVGNSNGQQHWNTQSATANWYKAPTGWSKWYAECEKAHIKVIKAEERKARSTDKIKKSSKCGFCESAHHNRRACPSMDALNERIIKANAHWRRRFYDRIVEDLGLGNGALVKVLKKTGAWNSGQSTEYVGIITSINFDEVNMFSYAEQASTNWGSRLDHKFQSPVTIKAIVDGVEGQMTLAPINPQGNYPSFNDEHGRPLVDVFANNWGASHFAEVISPTKQPLSDEWVSGGQEECVQFITKKYSLAKLKKQNVISTLENYEKRFNLC